jgi:hypothetical protein
LGVWCPAHSGPRLDNGGVANLLDGDDVKVACGGGEPLTRHA